MKTNKTAIILMGGGMRSAHGAGFLYALATKLNITSPDVMIGSSGDAGNVAYFCAGQYGFLETIWTEALSSRKFISLRRFWKVMDIDYLIDSVFAKEYRLDTAALQRSPIECLISATEYATGRPRYFDIRKRDDPLEILRASKAIPVLYGKRITVDGREYFDGEIGPIMRAHVQRATDSGANRILVINHVGHRSVLGEFLMFTFAETLPALAREAVRRDSVLEESHIEMPGIRVVCLGSVNTKAGTTTHDRETLGHIFEAGVQDALAHEKELRTLLA